MGCSGEYRLQRDYIQDIISLNLNNSTFVVMFYPSQTFMLIRNHAGDLLKYSFSDSLGLRICMRNNIPGIAEPQPVRQIGSYSLFQKLPFALFFFFFFENPRGACVSMNSPGHCLLLQCRGEKETRIPFELGSLQFLAPNSSSGCHSAQVTHACWPVPSSGQPSTCCRC